MLEDDDDLDYEEDTDYEPPMKPCPVCDGKGLYDLGFGEFLCTACMGEGLIENC